MRWHKPFQIYITAIYLKNIFGVSGIKYATWQGLNHPWSFSFFIVNYLFHWKYFSSRVINKQQMKVFICTSVGSFSNISPQRSRKQMVKTTSKQSYYTYCILVCQRNLDDADWKYVFLNTQNQFETSSGEISLCKWSNVICLGIYKPIDYSILLTTKIWHALLRHWIGDYMTYTADNILSLFCTTKTLWQLIRRSLLSK